MPSPDRNPLIVQSDRSILLETENPRYEEARNQIKSFSELIKSPEHFHTYRVTPISLWNALASGWTAEQIITCLTEFSRFPLPHNILFDVEDYAERFERFRLIRDDAGRLVLEADQPDLITEIIQQKSVTPYLLRPLGVRQIEISPAVRATLKLALMKIGFPVDDRAGYEKGKPLTFEFRKKTKSGEPWRLRPYQEEGVRAFLEKRDGGGVIILPCGAGKTFVGLGVMKAVGAHTLILTTSRSAMRQWESELLERTTLSPKKIGHYDGEKKSIAPVTLATYSLLSYRKKGELIHFTRLLKEDWGLVIFDDVHLLPTPLLEAAKSLQNRLRLGLSSTTSREDDKAEEVYCFIGPKRFDPPWQRLEAEGWRPKARCEEIRIRLSEEERFAYTMARNDEKYRIAATSSRKIAYVEQLLSRHPDDAILIIGHYLDQLERLRERIDAPIITSKMPREERERLYEAFRAGTLRVLIVSKVANFSTDLPEANVVVQLSGNYGSRQEEAQRIGRLLKPGPAGEEARFYMLVARDTKDQEYAAKRQLCLIEQGYAYEIHESPL
ncbi:MAG: helicase [Deltaproteobacteria bacterium]|nr:MAG: helicase [Deltaproteobacteria bacterium]